MLLWIVNIVKMNVQKHERIVPANKNIIVHAVKSISKKYMYTKLMI